MSTSGRLVWMTSVPGSGVSVRSIVWKQWQEAGCLHGRIERSVEAVLGVDGGEPGAVVPPHVRPQREVPRGRPRALPGGRQARVERAVGMAPHEGVEEVGNDTTVRHVRCCVGVKCGDVTPLEHDEVALLCGVGEARAATVGRSPGIGPGTQPDRREATEEVPAAEGEVRRPVTRGVRWPHVFAARSI